MFIVYYACLEQQFKVSAPGLKFDLRSKSYTD